MNGNAPNAVVLSSDSNVGGRIAYWLSTAGYRPVVAETGYCAHHAIIEGSTKLLITDRLLPPWPGLDTIFALKQSISGLTVAFLGDGVPDTRRLALQAGADLILPTPLRRAHVLEAMVFADPAGRLECAS
jgi:DNA-binding response OmpR family regulator